MLTARAAFALLTAHVLPGILVVRWLGLGRSSLERWIMAAVLGGPLAAVLYLTSLVSALPSLYWLGLVATDVTAVVSLLVMRRPPQGNGRPARNILVALVVLIAVVESAYMLTTGSLFLSDAEGNLHMDRALQRDTLFHLGMVRSLLFSYPPELLSSSGVTAVYHVGYHLQVAAWARFFGIDVLDGLYRVGTGWSLGLLVLSAFLLGRRFTRSDTGGFVAAVLLFGSGLGFIFASAPHADWWSLLFMDVTLVSVFLPNPLLPALPLLFVGLVCLEDYLSGGEKKVLLGSALGLIPLLVIKVFLGALILGGVALAGVLAGAKRLRRAGIVLCSVSLLVIIPMFSAGSGNTSVSLRPLEIVRYSMEKLDWEAVARALSDVSNNLGWAMAATLIWVIGFLGLRLLALPGLARDASHPRVNVRSPMAYAVLMGLVVALVFRVAPAEATGLARSEAFNDVVWFAAGSGILLWFWTAEIVSSFASRRSAQAFVAATVVLFGAFPCTVQHFVHKTSLDADIVPARLVEAARKAEELSSPGEVWVEPLNRVRPSLVAYLAGRPVVHDSYVGYDYMFIPEGEFQYRRHAVAQFWRTDDPAYVSWFFDRYGVAGVFATTDVPLPEASRGKVRTIFSSKAVRLYRVVEQSPDSGPISTPARFSLGLRDVRYFGKGWGSPSGSPRTRKLIPGRAELYVPRESGVPLVLRLDLATPHAAGSLLFGEVELELAPQQRAVLLKWPAASERGLHRLEIEWRAPQALMVARIDTVLGRDEK